MMFRLSQTMRGMTAGLWALAAFCCGLSLVFALPGVVAPSAPAKPATAAAFKPRSLVIRPTPSAPTALARAMTVTVRPGSDGSSGGNSDGVGRKRPVWTCGLCHTPTGWREIPKRVKFNHDRTGVPLTGAHATAACVGCHKRHPAQEFGKKAQNGLDQNRAQRVPRACAACHKGVHRKEQGDRCEACHTSRSWVMPRQFSQHAEGRFPLSGVHAILACASCHRNQARDQYRGTPTTCDACHQKKALAIRSFDHRPLRMGCNQCHSTFAWAPARFDHGVFWPLQGAHAAISRQCSKCHQTGSYSTASRSCASCHINLINTGKSHPDHRTVGLTNTCERCHTATSWRAMKPDWHEPAFPLNSGSHTRYRQTCSSCHPAGLGKGRFDCVNCHDGEHTKARSDSKHIGEVSGYVFDNPACLNCHPKGDQ